MYHTQGNHASKPYALTDGANIATNAALSNIFSVTLGGNRTLDNPTNLVHGMMLMWLVNNGTGPYTLAYGSKFTWGKGGTGTAPVLSTTASKLHVISGVYDSASDTIQSVMIDTGSASAAGTKTWKVFTAQDTQPPASNYATLTTRNTLLIAQLDPSTEESFYLDGKVPEGASFASGVKVIVQWYGASATSGDCVLGASWERGAASGGTDIDSDSFDTETTATTTTSGTSGVLNTTTITCTAIDSIAIGDAYRLKIARKAASGSDTMGGYCDVRSVEVQSV